MSQKLELLWTLHQAWIGLSGDRFSTRKVIITQNPIKHQKHAEKSVWLCAIHVCSFTFDTFGYSFWYDTPSGKRLATTSTSVSIRLRTYQSLLNFKHLWRNLKMHQKTVWNPCKNMPKIQYFSGTVFLVAFLCCGGIDPTKPASNKATYRLLQLCFPCNFSWPCCPMAGCSTSQGVSEALSFLGTTWKSWKSAGDDPQILRTLVLPNIPPNTWWVGIWTF